MHRFSWSPQLAVDDGDVEVTITAEVNAWNCLVPTYPSHHSKSSGVVPTDHSCTFTFVLGDQQISVAFVVLRYNTLYFRSNFERLPVVIGLYS